MTILGRVALIRQGHKRVSVAVKICDPGLSSHRLPVFRELLGKKRIDKAFPFVAFKRLGLLFLGDCRRVLGEE